MSVTTNADATAPILETCGTVAAPLAAVLRQVREVVAALSPEQYRAPGDETFSGATIGGHVRHCLDHVRAVVERHDGGEEPAGIDYDHRERGTRVETDGPAAEAELSRLIARVDALAAADAGEPVTVAVMPARDGRCVRLESTLGRELAFVLSHTVHHNAMIRGMALSMGAAVPPAFGFAPSTLAWQDSRPCAR